MSTGLDRVKSIYESKYREVYAAEVELIRTTTVAVLEFGTTLTKELGFLKWDLGNIVHPEYRVSKRIRVADKGFVLVGDSINGLIRWPITIQFQDEPLVIDVAWAFWLSSDGDKYRFTTDPPHRESSWLLNDDSAMREAIRLISEHVEKCVNERAKTDALTAAETNHEPPHLR